MVVLGSYINFELIFDGVLTAHLRLITLLLFRLLTVYKYSLRVSASAQYT